MSETPDTEPLVLPLSNLRPQVAARLTRYAYAEGRSVYWTSRWHAPIKRAAAALDGWTPAHGGTWRLDEGRTVVAFVPEGQPVQPMTYFPDRKVEHVLRCSSCGAADHRFAYDAPTYSPEVWTCPTCGSSSGETREVPVQKPQRRAD